MGTAVRGIPAVGEEQGSRIVHSIELVRGPYSFVCMHAGSLRSELHALDAVDALG